MICTQPNHTYGRATRRGRPRRTQPSMGRPQPTAAVSADAPWPLLTAIAAELRQVGEVNELASLRTARILLEEAFQTVDHAPDTGGRVGAPRLVVHGIAAT